jgi:hypothetical protein
MSNWHATDFVKNGNSLQPNSKWPDFIQNLMKDCLRHDPNSRPTFQDIVRKLMRLEKYFERFKNWQNFV